MRMGRLYWIAWGLYLALALSGALWIGLAQGQVPLALFVDPATCWLDIGAGLGAGLFMIALWGMARHAFPAARQLEIHLAELLGTVDGAEIVGLAVLSGFAEELFFRGAVQSAWGWLPATTLFTLLHTGREPAFRMWTLFAAVAGLLLAGLMVWRGNLLAPIIAHALVNAVNLRRLAAVAATASEQKPGSDPTEAGDDREKLGRAEFLQIRSARHLVAAS